MSEAKYQEAQEILIKGIGIEDSLTFLKQSGVYDHVSSLLLRLSIEKPQNALEIFENVSASIKAAGIKFPAPHDSKKIDEKRETLEVSLSLVASLYSTLRVNEQKNLKPSLVGVQQLLQQSVPVRREACSNVSRC